MPSLKAGAASLTKVRRPAAPDQASQQESGVSHSSATRAQRSVIRTNLFRTVALAVAGPAILIGFVIIGGIVADAIPPKVFVIGLACIGVLLMLALFREEEGR